MNPPLCPKRTFLTCQCKDSKAKNLTVVSTHSTQTVSKPHSLLQATQVPEGVADCRPGTGDVQEEKNIHSAGPKSCWRLTCAVGRTGSPWEGLRCPGQDNLIMKRKCATDIGVHNDIEKKKKKKALPSLPQPYPPANSLVNMCSKLELFSENC